MKKAIFVTLLISLYLFSGCNYLKIINYKPHDLTKTTDHKIDMTLISSIKPKTSTAEKKSKIQTYYENDPGFRDAVESICTDGVPKAAATLLVIAPIIGAAGKLAFDLHMEEIKNTAKAISKASKAEYSATNFITAKEFRNCKCALILRESRFDGSEETEPRKLGMLALLEINKHPESGKSVAFSFSPHYIALNNSVATTSKDIHTINLSYGLAVKSIGDQENKLPGLFTIGQGVVSVPNIQLKDPEPTSNYGTIITSDKLEGIYSDLIPYPNEDESILSVTFSVVEQGKVGFYVEQTEAELDAIKAAIGPAISATITNKLSEE